MSTEIEKRAGRPADAAKREAVLTAATAAFFDKGFAASSIEGIAADAGVSKVTVYNHFQDKRGLFVAAVENQCEMMRQHFSIGDISRGTLQQRLTGIGEAMVEFMSRPEMVQFERRIAAETEAEPEIGSAFLAAGPHRIKAAFAAFITAMVEAGELKADDPDLAAEQFVSLCKGIGDLERRFGMPNDMRRNRQRIASAVEVFCRAYEAKSESN